MAARRSQKAYTYLPNHGYVIIERPLEGYSSSCILPLGAKKRNLYVVKTRRLRETIAAFD